MFLNFNDLLWTQILESGIQFNTWKVGTLEIIIFILHVSKMFEM